jgi:outer membrane scaffolding protein for murein synthesis (MipA/OmpV family)
MEKELKKVMVVISACMLGIASSSFAATSVGGEFDDGTVKQVKTTTYTVGLGVAAVPQYEGSKDYKGAPVPFFRAQLPTGQYLQLMGPTLTVNLIEGGTWQAGPLLRYRGERNPDDIDNPYVKFATKKVDAAVELGGFVGFQANQWNARFDIAQDIADAHKGLLATLSGGYTFLLSDVTSVALNLSTTYASSDYMDTYFSTYDKAFGMIHTYTADAGIKDVSAAVIGRYRIDKNWGLIGALRLTELGNGAADSPVVKNGGSSTQKLIGVLATYTF